MSGVRDAIEEPPPTDLEAISEKKAADKGMLGMLKGMFGGKKKDGDGDMGGLGGIVKLIKTYQKIVKGIVIALGIGFIALLSQLKMSDLKKIWESLKGALMAIWDFIVPIVKVIWEWGKNTLLPAMVDYVVDQFNLIAELFTSIGERFAGWGAMSFKEKIFSVLGAFGDIGEWIFDAVGNLLVFAEKLLGGDGSFIKDLWGNLKKFFTGLIDWFILLFTDPTAALMQMWDGLFGDKGIADWLYADFIEPLIGWFKTLFDFSSIRTTIESMINLFTIIPNLIKKFLLDPAVKWIGDVFGWDTSSFTDFNIGELAMKGFDIVVKFFEDMFDIKLFYVNFIFSSILL